MESNSYNSNGNNAIHFKFVPKINLDYNFISYIHKYLATVYSQNSALFQKVDHH
jgi:hypothetical protein